MQRRQLIEAKMARAAEQRVELDKELSAFYATNPYAANARRDPNTQRIQHVMTRVDEPPPRVSIILGDVLHSLRSALDNLAYHLVWVGGGVKPGSEPSFPIADSERQYQQLRDGRACRGMTAPMLSGIDACRPFRGGDDRLWRLHRLENIDKHRTLILASSRMHSVDLVGHGFRMLQKLHQTLPADHPCRNALEGVPAMSMFFEVEDGQFPLKVGDVVFDDGPDGDMNEPMKFQTGLAIREEGLVEGELLCQVADDSMAAVKETLARLLPMLG